MKIKDVAVEITGTGFEGRELVIASFCSVGASVKIKREPNNVHDANAISVWLCCNKWFGLIKQWERIGYIKRPRAARWAPKIDAGKLKVISGKVHYLNIYDVSKYHPQVSVTLKIEE